jgi:hypothetical protein
MTPHYHYDWQPASKPPDTDRDVLVWFERPPEVEHWSDWATEYYDHDKKRWSSRLVTHWRDVEPPK